MFRVLFANKTKIYKKTDACVQKPNANAQSTIFKNNENVFRGSEKNNITHQSFVYFCVWIDIAKKFRVFIMSLQLCLLNFEAGKCLLDKQTDMFCAIHLLEAIFNLATMWGNERREMNQFYNNRLHEHYNNRKKGNSKKRWKPIWLHWQELPIFNETKRKRFRLFLFMFSLLKKMQHPKSFVKSRYIYQKCLSARATKWCRLLLYPFFCSQHFLLLQKQLVCRSKLLIY